MNNLRKINLWAQPWALSLYCLVSLAAYLMAILWIWKSPFLIQGLSQEKTELLKMVFYTFCFGGMGGIVYSIRGIYKHTVEQDFDGKYIYWHILRAPLGSVLGVVLYFLVQGGLLALSEDTPQETFRSKAFLVSAAFLAGFSTNQFLAKLKALSQTIFGVESHKSKDSEKTTLR